MDSVFMQIKWKDDGKEEIKNFARIPEEWRERDLSEHPEDESVFYWLTPEEWIALGAGESYADFDVIACACGECDV